MALKMTIKADMHSHTIADSHDSIVLHSAEQAILQAKKIGLNALSITNHMAVQYDKSLLAFAEANGITLIPGAELRADNKDILGYSTNVRLLRRAAEIRNLDKLFRLRAENPKLHLVAPHPFFPIPNALDAVLIQNEKYFDAVEINGAFSKWLDMNKEAIAYAIKTGKPLVANSDCHFLYQLGSSYTEFYTQGKAAEQILLALRVGRCKPIARPYSTLKLMRILAGHFGIGVKKKPVITGKGL